MDWLDILGYLIEVVSEEKQSRVTPASRSLTTDDMSMIMERANDFSLRTLSEKDLANKSKKDPWKSVKQSDDLQKAFNVLARYHHVAVESEGKLVNICSQMDMVRWLHNDPQRMGAAGRKSLQGLHLHRKRVVCVRENDLAIDAYYSLFKAQVSAAGVVDEKGILVGCLSAFDLKQIAESFDFSLLLKPVKEFVEDAANPIALHSFDTLADVVAKMVTSHVHRVFIVGPGGYPLGVVTTTDVCRVFAVPEAAPDKKDKDVKKDGDKKKDKDGDKKKDKKKKDKKKDKKKKK